MCAGEAVHRVEEHLGAAAGARSGGAARSLPRELETKGTQC